MIFLMASWLRGQPNGMAEPVWSYDAEAMEKQVVLGFPFTLVIPIIDPEFQRPFIP